MSRPMSKHTKVDALNPQSAGQCDLCGRWWPLREMNFQSEWAGNRIFQFGSLRCWECLDVPNEQLRTIVLEPDPPPIFNSRVPFFSYEEQTVRIIEYNSPDNPPWGAGPAILRANQNGETERIIQYLPYPAGAALPAPVNPAIPVLPWPPHPYLISESGQILISEGGLILFPG